MPHRHKLVKAVRDTILGGALGDALGAPHELKHKVPLSQYTGRLQYDTRVNVMFQEPKILPVGSVTDDTQMTIYLMTCLLNSGGYDRNKMILAYIDFANTYPTCLGKNTRKLFRNIKTIKGFENRHSNIVHEDNQSIGSLMRASGLAILPRSLDNENLSDIIESEVCITNSNSTNIIASFLHVNVLRLIYDYHLESVETIIDFHDYLRQYINDYILLYAEIAPDFAEAVSQALTASSNGEDLRNVDIKENKGWVCHGVYCAVWALFSFNDYQSGIDAVVRKGGDCDTTAKIAGDWLGALYGVNVAQEDIDLVISTNPVLNDLDDIVARSVDMYLS